jgi:hypothetical protein
MHVWHLSLTFACCTWIPLVILTLADYFWRRQWPMLLRDIGVHVRLLIAIPLFLFADPILEARCGACVRRLIEEGFVARSDARGLERSIERAHRLRDGSFVEVAFVLVAFGMGQAVLWRGSNGLIEPSTAYLAPSLTRVWYVGVALPVMMFVALRGVWHWAIWLLVLLGIARTKLELSALHPDRCGGIKFLQSPAGGFLWIGLGLSAIASSSWSTEVLFQGASASAFRGPFSLLIGLLFLISFGPLVVFSGKLYATRRHGLRRCDQAGSALAHSFESRWFDPSRMPGLIDTDNSSATIDFASTRDIVEKMRFVPIGLRFLAIYLAVVVAPGLLVVLTSVPMDRIAKVLARVLLG